MDKTCFIVAGPNGAGKSTFAEVFLPEAGCLNFINVDLIAKGIAPLKPERVGIEAGQIFLRKMDEFAAVGETFGFESTLSGLGYARRIEHLKSMGYRIVLFYLKLPSVEMAMERVARRVLEGGHDIPEDDLRRRFSRSWANFDGIYRPLADDWIVFDNSGQEPIVIEESE